jgi:hypothetical protein
LYVVLRGSLVSRLLAIRIFLEARIEQKGGM